MSESLIEQLQAAQQAIEPDFKALRQALAALKRAGKLAAEERLDAIAMQKALWGCGSAGRDASFWGRKTRPAPGRGR